MLVRDSSAVRRLFVRLGGAVKSDSHETWKCVDPELECQIRCFPYGERSDVPRLQEVEQKAVRQHGNLRLGKYALKIMGTIKFSFNLTPTGAIKNLVDEPG